MGCLDNLLTPDRVLCRLDAVSKKRVLELAANHVAQTELTLKEDQVYSGLLERERLGSTALGSGVAVPHCRVSGLRQPLGCLITLEEAIDYDAPDEVPVDLFFVLLVPPDAAQEHLDLLAEVAGRFSDVTYCQGLRDAASGDSLLRSAVESEAA